jgi:hypothetical protein
MADGFVARARWLVRRLAGEQHPTVAGGDIVGLQEASRRRFARNSISKSPT